MAKSQELTKAQLNLLLSGAGNDNTRPHLACVNFDTNGAWTTNGHVLSVVRKGGDMAYSGDHVASVSAAVIKQLCRSMSQEERLSVEVTGGEVTITIQSPLFSFQATVSNAELKAPPIEQVIPSVLLPGTGAAVCIDATYLKASALVQAAAGTRFVALYHTSDNPLDMRAIIGKGTEFSCYLFVMPCRGELDILTCK